MIYFFCIKFNKKFGTLKLFIYFCIANKNFIPMNDSIFYRAKLQYAEGGAQGRAVTSKEEALIIAGSYGAAEEVALELLDEHSQMDVASLDYELVKTKIAEVILNNTMEHQERTHKDGTTLHEFFFTESEDSSAALYSVDVFFATIDEKSGKAKYTKNTMYTPATSPKDAISRITEYLSSSMQDYIIRNVKYDKASSIIVDEARYTSFQKHGH